MEEWRCRSLVQSLSFGAGHDQTRLSVSKTFIPRLSVPTGMRRRRFLGVTGAIIVPLAGCPSRLSDLNGPATTPTRCEEPDSPDVRTVTETSATPTATRTDEQVDWTLDYDLLVRHAGPLGSDTDRVVTVTVIETVEGDCNPVAFARQYELEPGAEVAVEDPIPDVAEGTHRVHARLANGETATKEIHVHEDGIPEYAGYTVEIFSGEVELAKIQV